MPPWLSYNSGVFVGIPIAADKANVLVSLVAQGLTPENQAHDVFHIHVRQKPVRFQNPQCVKGSVLLVFYIDQKLENIKPQKRLTAIKNLSGFLGLNTVSRKNLCLI